MEQQRAGPSPPGVTPSGVIASGESRPGPLETGPGQTGPGRIGFGLAANFLLRVAAAAAGVALTLRLSGMAEVVGPAFVGFVGGLDSAVELLVAVPAGRSSDRWGRRPLLLAGAGAAAVGLLLAGLGDSLPLLALGRAVQGFGTGLTVPPLLGWISDAAAARVATRRSHPFPGRSLAAPRSKSLAPLARLRRGPRRSLDPGGGPMGRVMAGVEAGTAAGLLVGTVLGSALWSATGAGAFLALALLFVAAGALFARAPAVGALRPVGPLDLVGPAGTAGPAGVGPPWPSPAGQQAATHPPARVSSGLWADVAAVLRQPGLTRLLVAWVLLNAVVGLWLTHGVYLLNAPQRDPGQFLVGIGRVELQAGSLQTAALPVILALWMLLFIAGSLAWGPLLARIPAWPAMRLALVGMLVVCAALVVLNSAAVPAALRWAALPLFCAGVLLEAGFAPAALTRLADRAGSARRGVTMGLYSVAFGLGSVCGSWAGGAFSERWAMYGVIAATALLAATALATLGASSTHLEETALERVDHDEQHQRDEQHKRDRRDARSEHDERRDGVRPPRDRRRRGGPDGRRRRGQAGSARGPGGAPPPGRGVHLDRLRPQ